MKALNIESIRKDYTFKNCAFIIFSITNYFLHEMHSNNVINFGDFHFRFTDLRGIANTILFSDFQIYFKYSNGNID